MSYYTLDYPAGYKKSAQPYSVPQYLLLCGGPSNASDRVVKILSSQSLNPVCSATLKIMDEVKVMLKHLFQTTNSLTLAIQTSGNGGNETIITNLLEPSEKILVAISGVWSGVIADMADRHGLDVRTVRKNPGETFSLDELENAVITHQPALLFLVHGDSSIGAVQKLEGIGGMCHKYNCLFAVDAIASFCIHPIFVDRWEIDAISAASQKAVGATVGLSMLSFSPKAQERIFNKKQRPPYYFDLKPLAAYWDCCDKPRLYHYTFSSNLLAALREGLAQVCEEGIVNMWKRHEANAQLLWDKLDELRLEYLVKSREIRFNGVICVKMPNGIDETAFLDYLKTTYNIDVSPGFGPTEGKAMRIGLMGQNSRPEVVQYLIEALKDGLKHFEE